MVIPLWKAASRSRGNGFSISEYPLSVAETSRFGVSIMRGGQDNVTSSCWGLPRRFWSCMNISTPWPFYKRCQAWMSDSVFMSRLQPSCQVLDYLDPVLVDIEMWFIRSFVDQVLAIVRTISPRLFMKNWSGDRLLVVEDISRSFVH